MALRRGVLLLVWVGASSFSLRVRPAPANGGGVFVRGGGLDTLEDGPAFDAAVARSSRVAVLISAPWCRACRAIRPKLKRVSAEYEAKGVAFFEVSQPDVADMANESEFLAADDVKFTPMVQLYEERRRVDCFKAGPSGGYFNVRPKLDGWLDGRDPSGIVAPPRGPSKFEIERRAVASPAASTGNMDHFTSTAGSFKGKDRDFKSMGAATGPDWLSGSAAEGSAPGPA